MPQAVSASSSKQGPPPRELSKSVSTPDIVGGFSHRVYCAHEDEIKWMDLPQHYADEICPFCKRDKGNGPLQCDFEVTPN